MNRMTLDQLVFLDNLIYLDFSNIFEKYKNTSKVITTGTILDEVVNNIDYYTNSSPAAMTKAEWKTLLTSFKNNSENKEFLENYVVKNYVTNDTDENGMRAACFVNKNDTTDVAVVFRGTTGGSEWKDDVVLANGVSSDIMDNAALYIRNLPIEYGNNITVTGHSKGGNKAQYVTIVTDRIGECVSFDGQGFSQEFLEYYKQEIKDKSSKITSICGKFDYVNALLFPIAGEIKYIDGDYEKVS